jgi:uncharacterized membrane protein
MQLVLWSLRYMSVRKSGAVNVNFTKLEWLWAQFRRQLIYRAIIIGLLSLVAAFLGILLDSYVPKSWTFELGASAVDSLLSIIASSMLAVTTFSLSTVVAAYSSATSTATPRATNLLLDDTVTQNMLATFIGAFIYAIVGIILLKAGIYGSSGRLVLFIVTILVIGLIVLMLVRWIDFLMRFGRLGNVLDRIEDKAVETMKALRKKPCLGGGCYEGDPGRKPPGTMAVLARSTGYVQFIDMEALSEIAGDEGEITVAALPGSFISLGKRLAYATGDVDEDKAEAICNAFVTGGRRTFDQDPRLSLITMSEVASRALSPAVNDPGTAIEVLSRHVRIFTSWHEAGEADEPYYPNVRVTTVSIDDMFHDAFLAIGRDGAGHIEVVIRMMKSLMALASCGQPVFEDPAKRQMELLVERAMSALPAVPDRQTLAELAKDAGIKLTAAQKKAAGL